MSEDMKHYSMKANFYPAQEPKNGYIGMADFTIANAIRIRGIAVFEKEGSHHIQFPGYGEGESRGSYVIPASKDAYAEMLSVVEKAIADPEHHFGWTTGQMNPRLEVSGFAVTEPYADGRFSIAIEDLCTLQGITTHEVPYSRDGKPDKFVAVDMPSLDPYEKEGKKVYPAAFEGLVDSYEKDGEKKTKDFGKLIHGLVLGKRKELLERHPSIDEQVNQAQQKAAEAKGSKEGPAPVQAREIHPSVSTREGLKAPLFSTIG